jgi:hypothetical protein
MSDIDTLPPLHPRRVKEAREWFANPQGVRELYWDAACERLMETAKAALEVTHKLQTGFGFAPDLYEKVEMAKTAVTQGRTIYGVLKGLMSRK